MMLRFPLPKLVLVAVLAAAFTAGSWMAAAPAHAQRRWGYGPPPPAYYPPAYRHGVVVGFGGGVGWVLASDCGDLCGAGFAGELHIGGMLNPWTALMFDVWTNIHPVPNSDTVTSNTIFSGALQYWLNDILWLKGGLGVGHTQVTDNATGSINDATGFALMGAAGVEVLKSGPFAMDLQLRLGHTFHSNAEGGSVDDVALMVGFNWY